MHMVVIHVFTNIWFQQICVYIPFLIVSLLITFSLSEFFYELKWKHIQFSLQLLTPSSSHFLFALSCSVLPEQLLLWGLRSCARNTILWEGEKKKDMCCSLLFFWDPIKVIELIFVKQAYVLVDVRVYVIYQVYSPLHSRQCA